MSYYRRRRSPGGAYFFTVVTEDRAPILTGDRARELLHHAIRACQATRPFTLTAMVLLPDHFHAILELPEGEADYSTRLSFIKATFTRQWLASGGTEAARSVSRIAHRRRGVWQRRFWEHEIRDTDDFERHLNYIHYNPVKHGLAPCPHQWQWSSFQQWVKRDVYGAEWCCACDGRTVRPPSFEGMEGLELEQLGCENGFRRVRFSARGGVRLVTASFLGTSQTSTPPRALKRTLRRHRVR